MGESLVGGSLATLSVRGLLAQSGRSSVKSCVRAGDLTESGLTVDAQAIFDRLADEVAWPDQIANHGYLAVMVLPVAAQYKALRNRGWLNGTPSTPLQVDVGYRPGAAAVPTVPTIELALADPAPGQ